MRKAAVPESRFEKYCTSANLRTHGAIWDTYTAQLEGEPPVMRDVLKYETPLDGQQIDRLRVLNRKIKTKADVGSVQEMIRTYIPRDYKTSERLKAAGVKSVMTYYDTDYKQTDRGCVYYMTTDPYASLADPAFPSSRLTVGFVVDLGRRLFAIAKDMDNTGVNHRNINPFNIYFDENGWMVLGGFGCANIRDMDMKPLPPFLYFAHQAPDVRAGEPGSFVSDVYSIASIMKSFFLGQDVRVDPYGEVSPLVPDIIRSAIEDGMSCDPERVSSFRKKLNKAYHIGVHSWWDDPLSTVTSIRIGEAPPAPQRDSLADSSPEKANTIPNANASDQPPERESEEPQAPTKSHTLLDRAVSFAAGGAAAALLGYVALMFI